MFISQWSNAKKHHVWFFRALQFESVQLFTGMKFVSIKMMHKMSPKPNFTPIKLVDASYF